MKPELLKEFRNRFHKEPDHIFFCPGRVNLIGEHIDYNGGKVMPFAISPGIYLAISKNTEKKLHFNAMDFPETASLQVQESYSKTGKAWYNYPLGVIHKLAEKGHMISGLDMFFGGDLPTGAGLSSSAAIEVVTAFAITEMFGIPLSKTEIALLGKATENEFIGVNSGIMDQFAVAKGKEGHVILLNCDTLDHEYLPFQQEKHVMIIVDTKKSRELASSAYNERFIECGKALKSLKKELPVQHLCDIAPDEFLTHKHLIGDPILEKRALHVVLENERVKQAAVALAANDLVALGKLMFASHESLEELYEVSGEELDTVVEFSRTFIGCLGARMTGAGFGGCAIALVQRDKADEFAKQLCTYFTEKIGHDPDIFAVGVCDGVREVTT